MGWGRGFSKKGQRRVIEAPFRIKDWVKETAQLHLRQKSTFLLRARCQFKQLLRRACKRLRG